MNRRDLWLLAALLLAGVALWLGFRWGRQEGGVVSRVEVRRQGVLELSVPLAEARDYLLTGPDGEENELRVAEGKATMIAANCPDKLCVAQGAITTGGESIICLPHKLVVRLAGAPEDGDAPDTIAK